MMRSNIIFLVVFLFSFELVAQERVTTFGIQLKPIIPVQFFDAGSQTKRENDIEYLNEPTLGLSFGMVIRKGFTKSLSLETGLNFLRRNFDLTINDANNFSGTSDFSIVNYEIPVQGLVYVRLGRQMFMNVSGGVSFDIYPTPLFTFDYYFTNAVNRNSWLQTSLLANIGWEYRTEKSGFLYLGLSLHRPFDKIFREYITYLGEDGTLKEEATFDLTGNYITIDLRYFFHEEKQEKTKKTKKKQKVKRVFIDPRKQQ